MTTIVSIPRHAVRATLVALALSGWLWPTPIRAQVRDTLPATLVAQIAAAAGAYRTGDVLYVAFCRRPAGIVGVFDAPERAQSAVDAARGDCAFMAIATPPPDTGLAIPAALAKRLGEAADGYRTGQPVWFAAAMAYPHDIKGAFPSLEAVRAAVRDSLPGYGVFGPYVTPLDFDRATVLVGLKHFRPTIYAQDSLQPWMPDIPLPLDSIDRITLTVHPTTRAAYTLDFDPKEVDALFFTLAAADKFVMPYYTGVLGVDYAARMRARLRDYIRRAPAR